MARRRDPYSWISVRLPERDLGETVLDFASPLLAQLGNAPSIDGERRVLELAISFWNASVDAAPSALVRRRIVREMASMLTPDYLAGLVR